MSPVQTIFEINASSRDPSSQVMRAKRQKDRKAIARFQQGRRGRQEGPARGLPAPQDARREEEQAAGEDVEVRAPPWEWVGQVPAAVGLSSGLGAVAGGGHGGSGPTSDTRGSQRLGLSLPVCRTGSWYLSAASSWSPGGQTCFGIQNLEHGCVTSHLGGVLGVANVKRISGSAMQRAGPPTDEMDTSPIASRRLWLAPATKRIAGKFVFRTLWTRAPQPSDCGTRSWACWADSGPRVSESQWRPCHGLISTTVGLSPRSRAGGRRQRSRWQQRGRDSGSVRRWAFAPEGGDGAPQRRPAYLPGGILGLLTHRAIPLTSDLDTGSHGQNTALKTPGVVPAVRSEARPRKGQGLALVTQPGRRSCGLLPGCHPRPQHLSCPRRGLRWG